jgi:hypothetical protein
MLCGETNGIFCYHSFSGARMCCDKHTIPHFKMIYRLFLECIEFERVLEITSQVILDMAENRSEMYVLGAPYPAQVHESY